MNSAVLQYRIYLAILFFVFVIGMIGLITIEQFAPLDAVYFIIVTLATVGYGDLHPVTPAGKIISIIIILTGVGCFVGLVANSVELMVAKRERNLSQKKINMIIGVFFSEVGTMLLKKFSALDPKNEEIRSALIVSNDWSERDFSNAAAALKNHKSQVDSRAINLGELNDFLNRNKNFLLSLLENPQMIEHENFIPLLLAVFHLAEELNVRERLSDLPSSDYHHLTVDINRINGLLIIEWLTYMKHLKENYPHLFSLAMRTNPFDVNASPIVQ